MLIEIHMLKNYGPSNLNRDDSGSAKSCVFGGVPRGRISSQCLKRNLRHSPVIGEDLSKEMSGIRTRRLASLLEKELKTMGISQDFVEAAKKKITGFGNKKGEENDKDNLTRQIMYFSQEDIKAVALCIAQAVRESGSVNNFNKINAKDLQRKIKDVGRPLSLDIALFGRMVTSEAFRDVEGAVQMAHAFSTNRLERDFDFYTAVDEIAADDDDTGAGMLEDIEFNSNCYYHYFSIDTDQLLQNLHNAEGRKDLIIKSLCNLTRAFAYITPSGKQNSFASHPMPSLLVVELKQKKVPVSYANAFVEPARFREQNDLISDSIKKLAEEIEKFDKTFDIEVKKRIWLNAHDKTAPEKAYVCSNIKELMTQMYDNIGGAL